MNVVSTFAMTTILEPIMRPNAVALAANLRPRGGKRGGLMEMISASGRKLEGLLLRDEWGGTCNGSGAGLAATERHYATNSSSRRSTCFDWALCSPLRAAESIIESQKPPLALLGQRLSRGSRPGRARFPSSKFRELIKLPYAKLTSERV